ncbi:inositol monophosphatase family protein [Nocardioides cheoyonin]|uniref:inositol monophosphatase family protein n=1 Tax=Nocardioides cheoyonin TaxID=3156615 RepID=UPI0032B49431
MTAADGSELLRIALSTAREAAALVRERATGAVSVAATKSTPTDVVTEADRDSEALIRRLISERRPDDAFFGEEGGESAGGGSGVRWIVDPIDGTVNFLYGIARYAVSIAAEADGQVVAAVVVDVPHATEFTAYRTPDGAVLTRRDGEPIGVRPAVELSQRLVATGFSYDADLRRLQAEALVRLLPRIRDVRRIGSAALDICSVAEGTVDGYVEEGVHLWDHAAACLVAEGAGARWEATTGVGGRRLVLCAPAHGFEELRVAAVESGYLSDSATPGQTPE